MWSDRTASVDFATREEYRKKLSVSVRSGMPDEDKFVDRRSLVQLKGNHLNFS